MGGSRISKYTTGFVLIVLWFLFVVSSALQAYGVIPRHIVWMLCEKSNVFSKNCTPPPCWGYRFFHIDPPEFPVQFTVTPPGNPYFFSQFLVYPSGIPTTFTLPPGIFHWYPQQVDYNFFWTPNVFSKNCHQNKINV